MHGRRPRRLSRSPVTLSQVDLIWTDQTAQLDDGTFSALPVTSGNQHVTDQDRRRPSPEGRKREGRGSPGGRTPSAVPLRCIDSPAIRDSLVRPNA
jgi:hypothetical protein